MKKIVINKCYGGFGLSHEGIMRYAEIKGFKLYPLIDRISKDIYGDRAVAGNNQIFCHYYTVPVDNEEDAPDDSYFGCRDIKRDDPALIQAVEEMKKKANSRYSKLVIVEMPDDIEWQIEEYDGMEWVAECHRTWG